MKDRHSLLRRQIKKYFRDLETIPEMVRDFIDAVDEAYREFDTDREMLERALDLSSQELIFANAEMRAIFLALPDALITVNKQGVILNYKSSRANDLFFSQEGKVTGRHIRDIHSKSIGEKLEESLRQTCETNSSATIEYAMSFEGEMRFYEARMVPFLEDQTIIIVRNITGKKKNEEALRLSEERYRLLVENSNDAIFIIQGDTIKFPNQKTVMLFGHSAEELLLIQPIKFVHPDDKQKIMDMLLAGINRREKIFTGPFRIMNKDKNELWVETTAIPILWEGRPALINFTRDITEQRSLENRLLQAQKMDAIGTLAGGIAHDFNNILMGIQGYVSLMLLEMNPGNQDYEKLTNIEQFVQSGANLTRQLLGFARKGTYHPRATDLNEMIEKTSAIFGRTKKEIIMRIQAQPDIWLVEADQGQIEQVLLNLCVNAWQAMPGGGKLLLETDNVVLDEEFTREYGAAAGEYVKVSVTDTGTGMDEKTVERIFEPFFTTKGMGGRSVGLGLASVYGIVKNHNGIIQVRSQPGYGSTFTIYLPASPSSRRTLHQTQEVHTSIRRGKETILIVDDEQSVVNPTKKILENLGYNVFTACSGQAALDIYESAQGAIDLVILDMIMPGKGGAETFYDLKAIDPDVKVILSSGYSIGQEALAIMENGGRGFIQKPFKIDMLSEKVREALWKE